MQIIKVNTFEFEFQQAPDGVMHRTLTIVCNGVRYVFKLANPKIIADGTFFKLASSQVKLCFVPDSLSNLTSIKNISTLMRNGNFYIVIDGCSFPVNLMYSCIDNDQVSSRFGVFTNGAIQLAIES